MDSYPASRVVNSQAAGIGRIVSFGNRCAWNNLGRNVVFADADLRPRSIFGDTVFPEDDERRSSTSTSTPSSNLAAPGRSPS